MSTTTDVLDLFKYDPVADADNTFNITQAMNNNWDKLDAAVLLAIAAAGAYSTEKSYAVGDYCTYRGKLRKCSTAIPSGETWTESHWTTTTVAAEMEELSSQLSNRLLIHANNAAGLDCNLLIDDGRYQMQGGVGIPILNAPPWISSIYGHFFIDVFKNLDQWIRQVAYEVNSNRMYIRACLGGSWSPWELIATATKPQEYNIPFQSGWQAAAKATYCKTQEEVCVVNCSASGSGVASSNFIAALPAGFRPSATVCETAHVYKNGVRDIAEVHIGSGGDIVVYSPIEFDSVSFGVSFVIGFNYRQ